MDPLELLQSELSEENESLVVVNACKRLPLIASALGPERVRTELIPFLKNYLEATDNDEARVAAAESLGDMVSLIGGPEHAPILLPVLEILACMEETVVRSSVSSYES